jgi:hypothetical protein
MPGRLIKKAKKAVKKAVRKRAEKMAKKEMSKKKSKMSKRSKASARDARAIEIRKEAERAGNLKRGGRG